MVRIPTSLDEWSLELAQDLVQTLDGEPSWLDFKEYLNSSGIERATNKDSIRRTAVSMANAGGGFIVFGVGDARKYPDPVQRIRGITLDGEGRKQFNEKLSNVFPSLVGFNAMQLPSTAGHGLLVVHISTSPLRPHMLWPEGIFPKRSDGGSAGVLGVEEVREQMLGGEERRRKISLLMVKVAQYYRFADSTEQSANRAHLLFDRFDTVLFDNLLVDVWGMLPADWLVHRLMSISETANRVNRVLDLAATASHDGTQRGAFPHEVLMLQSEAGRIKNESRECLQRLEQLFEPLPQSLRFDLDL